MRNLKPGLYDQLIDIALQQQLSAEGETTNPRTDGLAPDDSHTMLTRHLASIISIFLKELGTKDTRLTDQVALCNALLQFMAEKCNILDISPDLIAAPARRLLAIEPKIGVGYQAVIRPDTPVSTAALLTNAASDPSLISQLKKEAASADSINILCSFIKFSGLRLIHDTLKEFTSRPGARLRVLTTCYCGATDAKAIETLARLPNTEIRISYEVEQTRLHAKAYQFSRDNGFGAAYIGSANMSSAALDGGLEWTVKVSQVEQPYLWDKIAGTFESHWNSPDFELFTLDDLPRFKAALQQQRAIGSDNTSLQPHALFDLAPYPFQQEILDRLAAERELNNRQWQLVVAATGTGKTMIAAFDFRNWRRGWDYAKEDRAPRFLFIAHRKEILIQARQKFQGVLRDHNFGELLVDGHEPEKWDAVFASIQTWDTRQNHTALGPGYFDYVIVDEFHHAAAASYQALLANIKPRVLLGLTATPERNDGLDVFRFFDGHITAQIRLPDAINRQLLAPFHYFCISDSVDLSTVTWERGKYRIGELEERYITNDTRICLILDKVCEYVADPMQARGLGFCVSKRHAAYMAMQFNNAGLPSLNLDADTPRAERDSARQSLSSGHLNFLFTVDLFNEGVDIPEIDLVLFLRPTESLTVFLQQLGRGLRKSSGKECLTVLDFVGRAHTRYSFSEKFAALLKPRRYSLEKEVIEGFPHLPAGCAIQMERVARDHILENVRAALRDSIGRWISLISDFEATAGLPLTLHHFLDFYNLDPAEIYRRTTWTRLLMRAGRLELANALPTEEGFRKGCEKLVHVYDPMRLGILEKLVNGVPLKELDMTVVRMISALFGKPWTDGTTLDDFCSWLVDNAEYKSELLQLIPFLASRTNLTNRIHPCAKIPQLALHGKYSRDEILFASGYWTADAKPMMNEGVMHVKSRGCDIFLVTLVKNEKEYSPTTLYADYAISPSLFHWQTQSRTSAESPTGQRYFNHAKTGHEILLFVREERQTVTGATAPYYFLGPVQYVSHEGSRPVSITWQLDNELPAHLYRNTASMEA